MGDSYVCTSALMTCTFGLVPCPLVVNPSRNIFLQGKQRANISDFVPITNIASFGMCSAPTNPSVIAATAAAMGVLTPMPCVPAIVSPWIPGKPDVLVQGMPALTKTSRNMCMWLGQISFTNDGQIPMPPPVCTPPVGSLSCVPTGVRAPLSSSEMSSLSGGGGAQYENDICEAQKAGSSDKIMGDAWEQTAKDYEKKGDTENASAAQKNAEKAKNTAADKNNIAMGDVNQRYRESMPMSDKQMSQLTLEQQQDYQQQCKSIVQKKEAEYQAAEQPNPLQSTMMNEVTKNLKKHYADMEEQNAMKELNKKHSK